MGPEVWVFMFCSISACVSAGPRMAICIWDTFEGPLLRGVTNDGRTFDRLVPRLEFDAASGARYPTPLVSN